MRSTKPKDKNDRIEEFFIDQKIEDGIRKGLNRWMHTICVTTTSAIISFFYWAGNFIYVKWLPLQAAARAFYEANKP